MAASDHDRLTTAVDRLNEVVTELGKAVARLDAHSGQTSAATAQNRALIEQLRNRIDTLEQWKASAMVKLAAMVFAAAVLATVALQQLARTPAPVVIQQAPATAQAPHSP